MKKTIIIAMLLIGTAVSVIAETDVPPKTCVLIVSGINKDPEERQTKDKAVIKLQKFFLNDANIPSDCVKVLVDKNSFVRQSTGLSTAENLKKTIAKLALLVKPSDRFIFYYIGQANVISTKLRFNLPGEDMTHEQLAVLINSIKASEKVIIIDCPQAGLTVKKLSAPGRIVLCGARSDQPYSPHFSEFFVPALTDIEADTDIDGKISLLEAFTMTSQKIDQQFDAENLLKTENPILEDDGDGIPSQQPWRHELEENDGLTASKCFLAEEKHEGAQNE